MPIQLPSSVSNACLGTIPYTSIVSISLYISIEFVLDQIKRSLKADFGDGSCI